MITTPDLPDDVEALKAIIMAQRDVDGRARVRIEHLEKLVAAFKQALFGRKSEKIDPDQFDLALEDIGLFWDLPNWDEAKYYYFQCVDLPGTGAPTSSVAPIQPDALVDEYYAWRWSEGTHRRCEQAFGAVAVGFGALAYFAL